MFCSLEVIVKENTLNSCKLKEIARRLRKSGILSEVLLWRYLKRKQVLGYNSDRQKPIDNYIVDFFCNELMLAVEIDGCSHNERSEADKLRQAKLESWGIRFLRFYDSDIKKNMQGVLWVIEDWIRKHKDEPTPDPSQEGNFKGDPSSEGNLKKEDSQEGNEEKPGQSDHPVPHLLKGHNGRTRKVRGQKSLFPEKEANGK